jgi:ABC-type multidrug transport system ATPase subunit
LSKLRSSDKEDNHVDTSDHAEKAFENHTGKHVTERRILNGLSGHVQRGEFVGILGASGAGKTTLLNALSGRMGSTGRLSGQVLFNGKKRDAETWKRVVGYVQQDDALLPRLTVRETIEMSSKLRLPDKTFSTADKQARAEEVLDMLRLEDCAESRIGNEAVRGVSGGERKRTSIGIVSRMFHGSEGNHVAKS